MPSLMSNHLKAVLLTDDITVGIAEPGRSQCYTLQHFEYKCERDLDGDGMPFGFTASVILKASVRISASCTSRIFLERLKQDTRYPFTFIFNPTFDSEKKMSDYGGAMVVYGYIVDVEEQHRYSAASNASGNPSILNFNILVSSMTYLGKDAGKTLYITHSSD